MKSLCNATQYKVIAQYIVVVTELTTKKISVANLSTQTALSAQ